MQKSFSMASLGFLALGALLLGPWAAISSGQTIVNGNFETPDLGGGSGEYNPPTGAGQPWTFLNQSGIAIDNPLQFDVSGSSSGQFAFLQMTDVNDAAISQTISFSSAGSFTLSYLDAGRDAAGLGGDLNYHLTIQQGVSPAILSVFDSTTSGQPFTTNSYNFTVPAAGNYTLTFTAVSHAPGNGSDDTAFIDNVAVTATAPEPSSLVMMLGGLGLLGCMRRFRRAKKE